MAVVITVATNGGYKTFSSENATLATAFSEVINELEEQKVSWNQTQCLLTYDVANSVYAFAAVVRS